jgi:hypothetical protein
VLLIDELIAPTSRSKRILLSASDWQISIPDRHAARRRAARGRDTSNRTREIHDAAAPLL